MAGQLRASGSSRIRKEGQAASKQSTVTASSKGKGRKPGELCGLLMQSMTQKLITY